MAKAKLPPYTEQQAHGGLRWKPSPRLRRAKTEDGKPLWPAFNITDEFGAFLPLAEAIAVAERQNALIARWEEGTYTPVPGAVPVRQLPRDRSVSALIEHYKAWTTPAKNRKPFRTLSDATRRDYELAFRLLRETWADTSVTDLDADTWRALQQRLVETRGKSISGKVMATGSVLMSHAWRPLRWINGNPIIEEVAIERAPPRLYLWRQDQLVAMIRTADAMGLPSVADAIVIALYTALRQSDVLALTAANLPKGTERMATVTAKTGAGFSMPFTPQLRARLAAMEARHRAAGRLHPARLVLTEAGRIYSAHHFRKQFALVRFAAAGLLERMAAGEDDPAVAAARAFVVDQRKLDPARYLLAIAGLRAEGLAPVSDLMDATFSDLRDTAITRLAEAGCTIAQIRAISTHSEDSILRILKHYLVLTGQLADAAVENLVAYLEKSGADY